MTIKHQNTVIYSGSVSKPGNFLRFVIFSIIQLTDDMFYKDDEMNDNNDE